MLMAFAPRKRTDDRGPRRFAEGPVEIDAWALRAIPARLFRHSHLRSTAAVGSFVWRCFRSGSAVGRGAAPGVALKHAPVHPNNAAIFTDLDPAGGVPLGLPAGVLGKGEEHGGSGSRWFQSTFVRLPTALAVRYWNMARQRYYRPSARCCGVRRVSADRAARPGRTPAENRGFST